MWSVELFPSEVGYAHFGANGDLVGLCFSGTIAFSQQRLFYDRLSAVFLGGELGSFRVFASFR